MPSMTASWEGPTPRVNPGRPIADATEAARWAWSSGWQGYVCSTAVPSSMVDVARPAIAMATSGSPSAPLAYQMEEKPSASARWTCSTSLSGVTAHTVRPILTASVSRSTIAAGVSGRRVMVTPQRGEGVGHGVDDGRRGADGPALTDALVAAGTRAHGLDVAVLDLGHLGDGRDQVVDERAGDGVAVVVVGEVLVEGPADALDGAAVDLALDHVGVDHRPAVLADDVAQQRDHAGLHVDLAGAHVGGVGPDGHGLGLVAGTGLEARRHVGGQREDLAVGDGGDLGDGQPDGRGAPDGGPAVGQLDVLGRGFEAVGGDGDQALAQDGRRLADRSHQHRPAAAAPGAEAERA